MSIWADNPEWFDAWAIVYLVHRLGMDIKKAEVIESPWEEIRRLMPYTWGEVANSALQDFYHYRWYPFGGGCDDILPRIIQ